MIIGIGTDICEIARIEAILKKDSAGVQFIQRIFTKTEQQAKNFNAVDAHFVARRFAAKEAVAKALGTGIGEALSFQDFSIVRIGNTPPKVHFENGKLEDVEVKLSISDEKSYAVAFAIAQKRL